MTIPLEDVGARWADDPEGSRRLAVLAALADDAIPAVDPPERAGDLGGFWQRTAEDLGTSRAVAGWIDERLGPEDAAGLRQLLDILAKLRVDRMPAAARRGLLKGLCAASPDAAAGLDGLRKLSLMVFYGHTFSDGANPNWPVIGYPGPPSRTSGDAVPVPASSVPAPDASVLSADVCIVGSGAGGAVIAAELATAGLDVIVLEAGTSDDTADHPHPELEAWRRLYWRGGLTLTSDGMVAILAGATLGGGTTVNWTNCVPPPAHVRTEWEEVHGLGGLAGPDFDGHLEAVSLRMSVTDACSDRNGPNEVLARGAEALGWSWGPTSRNVDPVSYDPASAGHMGFGDASGARQGVLATHLRDAVEAGARILVRSRARRVLADGGAASGVEVAVHQPDGSVTDLTIRAPRVVVAAGALETPALLLRSDLGGAAVGHHLRLHPVAALAGLYAEDQRAWWGPPQAVVIDQFSGGPEGHGFLLETAHWGAALAAASLPALAPRDHKIMMSGLPRLASSIGLVRDRGAGRVTIDEDGEAVVTYPLDDPLDRANLMRSLVAQAELHRAAGARTTFDFGPSLAMWRVSEDIQSFVDRLQRDPMGAGGRPLFSAHQMGTARMGTDPATSVADPFGQLHTTPGVWIGDTSAFPTAVGSNPMLTVMALAHRTARAMLDDRNAAPVGSVPALDR